MYVVVLTYVAPLEEVDQVLPEHAKWLQEHFDAGEFVAAGPRSPRTGGVIIARRLERAELDAVLAADPFAVHQVATYEVIEFGATRTAPELAPFTEAN
jgi:uncharacterized protein YciI